jgi:hypothetical protein
MSTAFKLRNGTILLSTEAPGGIYNAAQLKKIAQLCEGEVAIVKATEDQRLALCVKPEQASGVAKELQSIGLGVRHYQDGLHHPTSCLGELCPDHEQDALGSALDISQQLEDIKVKSPLKIGINGCAKCCVPCHTLDISVVGDTSGYRVSLGGKNSQIPEMASFIAEGVPSAELPGILKAVVELYKTHASEGEALQDVMERIGARDFIAAFAPYSQDAGGAGDEPADLPESTSALESSDTAITEDLSLSVSEDELGSLEPEIMDSNGTSNEDLSLTISEEDLSSLEPEVVGETQVSEEQDGEAGVAEADMSMDGPDLSGLDIDPNSGGDASLGMNDDIDISSGDVGLASEIALSDNFGEDDLDIGAGSESSSVDLGQADGELNLTKNLESLDEQSLDLKNIELEAAGESIELADMGEPHLDEIASEESSIDSVQDGITDEPIEGDMSEVAIDVSDVMKAGAPQIAQSSEAQATEAIVSDQEVSVDTDSVPEVDETAYEDSLNESIDAQEKFLDESDSVEQREKSLEEIENSEAGLDTIDVDELPSLESINEVESEDDELPLSEIVAILPSSSIPNISSKMAEGLKQGSVHSKTWSYSNVDIDDRGYPVIAFTNGIKITLTPEFMSTGQLTIGGHTLTAKQVNGGMEVFVDGMKLFVPAAA